MIEITKDVRVGHDYFDLFIDDDEVTDSVELDVWGGFQGAPYSFDLKVSNPEIIARLIAHSFSDLPEVLDTLNLEANFDTDFIEGVSISQIPTSPPAGDPRFAISFDFRLNLPYWRKGYNYEEYYNEVRKLVEATNDTEIQPKAGSVNRADFKTAEIFFLVASPQLQIASEISRCSNVLRDVIDVVKRTLASRAHSDEVFVAFDFPEEVRIPCEQYLLYFAQFLKDLGVDVTSELSREAGQVLFTVTPTNKQEALDKIRTALQIYLYLPAGKIGNLPEVGSDVAIERLAENVRYFKRQLELSRELLEVQKTPIRAEINIHQQHSLTGHVIIDSLIGETAPPPEEEKEEILGGTVLITKYKGKGFEIDLPKVVRWIRRLFAPKA